MGLRTIQVCDSARKTATIDVASKSDPSQSYSVTVSFVDGVVTCTCPGFKYRGTCHHTQLREERCGWTSDAPERQTHDQEVRHICPKCAGITFDVVQGAK